MLRLLPILRRMNFRQVEEIAAAVLYLAPDESPYVTETDLVIDDSYTV